MYIIPRILQKVTDRTRGVGAREEKKYFRLMVGWLARSYRVGLNEIFELKPKRSDPCGYLE